MEAEPNRDDVRVQIDNVQPTQIVVKNFSYIVQDKTILDKLNINFQPGRLSVIVGPSGSGKTTLVSLLAGLAGNMSKQAKQSGQILMNGKEIDQSEIRKFVGFVFQDDVILETIKVEEAIEMSILLRVGGLSNEQQKKLLDRMIDLAKLESARSTMIGSPLRKGISGGERKRAAISMELVTNPAVMLLDEPTSGLDTYTAYRIVALLKRLAHRFGRTVVATLHQPSSEIFHLIDDLYVLHEGKLVYGGPANQLVPYFTSLGYEFDRYSNPLDVLFMSILNRSELDEFADEEGREKALSRRVTPLDELPLKYKESDINREFNLERMASTPTVGVTKQMYRFRAKSMKAFMYLCRRDLNNTVRNQMVARTRVFQTLFLALFILAIYWGTRGAKPPQLFQNLSGLLFFLIINSFFATFNSTLPIFGAEKAVFLREHSQRYYGLTSYFLAKIVVQIPYIIIFPVVTAAITYFGLGLRSGVGHFLLFTVALVLVGLSGFAFAVLAASLFADVHIALAVSIVFILPAMVLSSFLVNLSTVVVWLRWLQWISPLRYMTAVAMENQFSGWTEPGAEAFWKSTSASTGFSIIGNMFITIGIIILVLFLSYCALWRVIRKNSGKAKRID